MSKRVFIMKAWELIDFYIDSFYVFDHSAALRGQNLRYQLEMKAEIKTFPTQCIWARKNEY